MKIYLLNTSFFSAPLRHSGGFEVYFLATLMQRRCGILFLLFLCSCAKIDEKPISQNEEKNYPVMELKDSIKVDMYDGSLLTWKLKTNYMKEIAGSKVLFARPVDMVIFDSLGKESAWIIADSGSADEAVTFVSAWGHVHARSLEGATVQADSLTWKKRTNQIQTDGWVKVVSQEGDTLTGVGFVSDDKLANWKIISDFRGVIRKVETRTMEPDSAGGRVNAK